MTTTADDSESQAELAFAQCACTVAFCLLVFVVSLQAEEIQEDGEPVAETRCKGVVRKVMQAGVCERYADMMPRFPLQANC